MADVAGVPIGAVGEGLKLAWAGWGRARDARGGDGEIASVLDHALRCSLCPSAPDAEEVGQLSVRILNHLADVPPAGEPPTRLGRFQQRARGRLPRVFRRNRLPAVAAFGHDPFDGLLG